MLKEIPKSDVIVRPLKVYKEWTLDENDISPIFGENGVGTFVDLDNDAIKEVTGVTNADIFYYAFDNMFYNKLIWEFGDDEQPRWVHISFSTDHKKNKKRKTYRAIKRQGKVMYLKFKDRR